MTAPAPIPARLTPAAARTMLVETVDSNQVAASVRDFTWKLVGLDAWPPENPRTLALDVLDRDEAPEDDEVFPAAKFRMASILLALDAHNTFEAGRAMFPVQDDADTEVLTARARDVLSVVNACGRIGVGIDESAALPFVEDALRPYVSNERRMASTLMQLRDVLYPGGSGGEALGGEELGMVNNIMRTMGYGPTDGRDGPDDTDPDVDGDG